MIPSHVLAAGNTPLTTAAICGGGSTGLVATGTTQADALQLPNSQNTLTTSSASTGVKLPPCQVGAEIWIRNDSGQTIAVYPNETSGVTINAGASSVNIATAKTMVLKAMSGTTWASILTA